MALVTAETTGFVLAGRYRLERRIGGTKTRVWSARDQLLLRTVAVKILDGAVAAQSMTATRALAKLSHPNIVIINDVEGGDSSLYVVMEMLDGTDLASRLRDGPLPWLEAVRICADVAAGLGAAHYSGMVHGDLRPQNIVMTGGRVKVCGFGSVAQDALDRYAPPEGTPSYAGDVYTLGVILSEALMGRIAVDVALPEDVPDDVARLCLRAMSADPGSRPTARELAKELAAVAAPGPPPDEGRTLVFEAPPPPPRPRLPRRPLAVGAGLAAVLAVALAAGILANGPAKLPTMDNVIPIATPTTSAYSSPSPPPVARATPSRRPRATPSTDLPVTLPRRLSPAVVLNRLQRAIDAGTATGEIRDDVGVDLTNQVVALRRTRAAALSARAAAFQAKVATRLREHALTRRAAVVLVDIAAELR
jgi:serine/threonine protein kinase